jgi:hypothetical protein
MMNVHAKKRNFPNKDGDVPIELTKIMLNDEESNDRQQVMSRNVRIQTKRIMSKDVHVQTEQEAITLDDEQVHVWPQVMSDEVEIKSDSPYMFDELHLTIDGEEILDQGVNMEDSVNAPTGIRRGTQPKAKEPEVIPTNIINEITADLGPIVGYADEAMLPLSKACSPLANILHDMSSYVQMALDETPEQPPDGLTVDESAAIRLYTIEWAPPHRSLYSMLNYTLKSEDREHLRPYFKYLKLFLTALIKLPCVPPLTLWRGVTKNLSAEFPPGTPVTWWAFSSCTTELTVLENNMYLGDTGDRTLFSVEAINGRTIRAHSHFVTEEEILLLCGTHMIVQSQFSPAPELHIIHLKQVVPKEVLLEPPFEGILNIFNHLFSINSISTFRCTSLSKDWVSLI